MERLTIYEIIEHCERKTKLYEEIGKSIDFETIELKGAIREYWEHKQVKEYLEELKQYRYAEEQGLLLRLPCKDAFKSSGDTVYYIFDYEIVECTNCGVSIDWEGKLLITLVCDEHIFPYRRHMPEIDLDPTDWCDNTTEVSVDEWGKTVFLTQTEAEQKLKEMESD